MKWVLLLDGLVVGEYEGVEAAKSAFDAELVEEPKRFSTCAVVEARRVVASASTGLIVKRRAARKVVSKSVRKRLKAQKQPEETSKDAWVEG